MPDLPALPSLPLATLDEHPVAVYLARLTSVQSRRSMQSKLDVVARLVLSDDDATAWDVPWARLQPIHLDALRAVLAERYAPRSANCMMSAVKGVLKACWRLGQLDAERLARLVDVETVRGSSPPAGRALEVGELRAMLEVAAQGKPHRAARDQAAVALLYGGGLRRAELVALDVADLNLEREEVLVRRGKGSKARVVPLALGAAGYVVAWIELSGRGSGPLLLPVNKGDAVQDRRLSPEAIGLVVQRLARDAGLTPATAHDFRRTLIGDLLDAGADLATVQQLAGHASPTTTARYDRRPAEARRKAARMVRLPGPRQT